MVLCDFCSTPNPAHCWVSKPSQFKLEFGRKAVIYKSDEHWAACDYCNSLILENNEVGLAKHSAALLATGLQWEIILMMHQTMFWQGSPAHHSASDHPPEDDPCAS